MNRTDAVLGISKKIKKNIHLFNTKKTSMKCKCDNMALRILDYVEHELGMLPPYTKSVPEDFPQNGFEQEFLDLHDFKTNRWDDIIWEYEDEVEE